jgi:hypothetical protein
MRAWSPKFKRFVASFPPCGVYSTSSLARISMRDSPAGNRPTGGGAVAESLFRKVGDGYVLTVPAHELEFHAERLRWRDDDLKGELAVMCGIVGGRAIDGLTQHL